jgi:two-component system sensor histidine kinase CiaH
MIVSVTFSAFIYSLTAGEIDMRLQRFQTGIQSSRTTDIPPTSNNDTLRAIVLQEARENLSLNLLYINLVVLVAGGFISYLLARHNLAPIEKAHESQSRFTSDASHELRTPLAVMKTELEVALRDKSATAGSLKEVLSSSLEEVDKLSKLAEMLLSLSQIENAKLKISQVNINKLTHEIIKDLGLLSNRITVNSNKQPTIQASDVAIADLIKILIDNAVQYSPKDSTIKVDISEKDQQVKFEIINIGPGIQPDKLPYIFDRFYRADSSRTEGARKSYGLGLALAKKIVDLHNGRLIASSTPDVETSFIFILPKKHDSQAITKF